MECFYKEETGKCVIGEAYTMPEYMVKYNSIPYEMSVADIYEDVEFER